MLSHSTERLTDAQRECLRLVLAHHSSKEIAIRLGVSPSAIDKRLERAVQILGARSRFEAARRLAESEAAASYEHLPSERIDLPDTTSAMSVAAEDTSDGLVRRLVGLDPGGSRPATARNGLTGMQRIVVMVGLVLGLAIAALILAAVATTLTQLVKAAGAGSEERSTTSTRS